MRPVMRAPSIRERSVERSMYSRPPSSTAADSMALSRSVVASYASAQYGDWGRSPYVASYSAMASFCALPGHAVHVAAVVRFGAREVDPLGLRRREEFRDQEGRAGDERHSFEAVEALRLRREG